jgi:hypothetical protein
MWKVDEQQETKIDKKWLEYLILTFGPGQIERDSIFVFIIKNAHINR